MLVVGVEVWCFGLEVCVVEFVCCLVLFVLISFMGRGLLVDLDLLLVGIYLGLVGDFELSWCVE